MNRFPTGYVQDQKDYGYRPHTHLVSALPPLQDEPTMSRFRGPRIWQDGIGECVGSAMRRCVQLWHKAHLNEEQPEISDLAAYTLGRLQERAGQDPDEAPPLQDVGSQPGLVLLAAQRVGVVLRDDWPGPDHPRWEGKTANTPPTPRALTSAYDMRGLEFLTVPTGGTEDVRKAVRDCLIRMQPVMWAMFVDNHFMENEGEIILSVDREAPGGGHMLAVLDATHDDYLVADNWWRNDLLGIPWGAPDGTFRISWDCFAREASAIFAVKAAPLTKRDE